MLLKNNLLLLFIFALTLLGCKDKSTPSAQVDPDPLENGISSSFWTFFETWQSDSIYQKQHILFPLKGLPANADQMVKGETFYYQKDAWVIHRPFDDMGGTFNRSYSQMGHLVTETVSDQSGMFQMERRFAKMDDEWMMIYYAAMRMVR